MTKEEKQSWAVGMLKQKEAEIGRIPRKDDFDEATRSRIKAFLGPWPRALEAAGLKPLPETGNSGNSKKKRRKANAKHF